jgi:hypothetical protein
VAPPSLDDRATFNPHPPIKGEGDSRIDRNGQGRRSANILHNENTTPPRKRRLRAPAPHSRHQPTINHVAGLLECNASREDSIKVDGTFA